MIGKATTLRLGQYVRNFAILTAFSLIAACSGPQPADAAPYAAHVMDARTGETLYSENSETRAHPASLTKMMTLYIAFEEIERGRLSLDTMITVSKYAAAQPPSRLGLKAGQKIQLRYLIRAAAVKSANDAAAAIGDHISGNHEKFAARMTKTARALGMKDTTFKNAHGLTAKGHLSTPRDMSVVGRHLFYDFPQYYNIFSRRSTDAGIAQVNNTNRRFLDAYKGADGIKTGYTDAAGFNLTGSAERGGVRIIATVFGGKSTADRNAKMADLLDLGFRKAGEEVVAAMQDSIAGALAEAAGTPPPADSLEGQAAALSVTAAPAVTTNVALVAVAPRPEKRKAPIYDDASAEAVAEAEEVTATEVVTLSTSGGRHYGVMIGQFNSHNEADRFLTKTVLAEGPTLGHGLRKVVRGNQGFTGNVLGLTQREADLACARLQARGVMCFTMGEATGG